MGLAACLWLGNKPLCLNRSRVTRMCTFTPVQLMAEAWVQSLVTCRSTVCCLCLGSHKTVVLGPFSHCLWGWTFSVLKEPAEGIKEWLELDLDGIFYPVTRFMVFYGCSHFITAISPEPSSQCLHLWTLVVFQDVIVPQCVWMRAWLFTVGLHINLTPSSLLPQSPNSLPARGLLLPLSLCL